MLKESGLCRVQVNPEAPRRTLVLDLPRCIQTRRATRVIPDGGFLEVRFGGFGGEGCGFVFFVARVAVEVSELRLRLPGSCCDIEKPWMQYEFCGCCRFCGTVASSSESSESLPQSLEQPCVSEWRNHVI